MSITPPRILRHFVPRARQDSTRPRICPFLAPRAYGGPTTHMWRQPVRQTVNRVPTRTCTLSMLKVSIGRNACATQASRGHTAKAAKPATRAPTKKPWEAMGVYYVLAANIPQTQPPPTRVNACPVPNFQIRFQAATLAKTAYAEKDT